MKLGSILGAIAGVAAIATGGWGIVAGLALLAGAAASAGLIGGSIGKFLNSGLGRGLMGGVALGSMAYAAYVAPTGAAGAPAPTVANMGGGGVINSDMSASASADAQVAAMTNISFMQAVGANNDIAQMAGTAGVSESTSGLTSAALK